MFTRLLDPDVWKPVLIVNITNMLITWCAIQALDRYVVVIFKASGSNVGKQKFIDYGYINLLVFFNKDREVLKKNLLFKYVTLPHQAFQRKLDVFFMLFLAHFWGFTVFV